MKTVMLGLLCVALLCGFSSCPGLSQGLSEEDRLAARMAGEEIKALKEKVDEARAAIDEMRASGEIDPARLAELTADVTSYMGKIEDARSRVDSIMAKARDQEWGAGDWIGYVALQLIWGALGYLGIGRPARRLAGTHLLNRTEVRTTPPGAPV